MQALNELQESMLKRYQTVRDQIQTASSAKPLEEAWSRLFRPPVKVVGRLYLHSFAEMSVEVQALHAFEINKLLEENDMIGLAWWLFASIQGVESEFARSSKSILLNMHTQLPMLKA